MSGRTCGKCRLHGKIQLLRGHKRACPFTNCNCNICASHERALHIRNQQREQREDKGRRWRASLAVAATSTTNQQAASPSALPFPEMPANSASGEDALTALQLANYETAGLISKKSKSNAEKKKGSYIIFMCTGAVFVYIFLLKHFFSSECNLMKFFLL